MYYLSVCLGIELVCPYIYYCTLFFAVRSRYIFTWLFGSRCDCAIFRCIWNGSAFYEKILLSNKGNFCKYIKKKKLSFFVVLFALRTFSKKELQFVKNCFYK